MIPLGWAVAAGAVAFLVGWWCGGIARGRSLRTIHREARHRDMRA